jgi:phosphoribosylglycinamide formyltransferase 2
MTTPVNISSAATAGSPASALAPYAAVFGTPLTGAALRVMLLGAGELGKEVILALQRLGVEVIAVDRYADAPGQQVAHRAYVVAMTDKVALRAVIEKEQPHLIVPEIEAIATDLLVELEAVGMVRVTPTARAAQLTMNREGIRRLAAETLGLPTSPYRFADSLASLAQATTEVGFPCLVKPVMSSSGKGQSVLHGPEDIASAWSIAKEGARVEGSRIIVEGFIDFEYEITLLTVRARGSNGQVETHFCEPIGHLQVGGDYVESWQPQPMSPRALERAQQIARKVTDNLGGQGLFGVELFVSGDEVWFSEVSPRPHDTGLVTLVSQGQSEFELHARALLGLPVDTALRGPAASSVIYGGIEAKAIRYEGVAEALSEPGTDLRLFGKPESFVKRRMGVALATDATVDQARAKALRVSGAIRVKAA